MASTSEYADLKAAVRTQKEQAAAIATAVRDAEERVALAELEVVRAKEDTERERAAREKAEAELTALHRQHRQHRRMAARSTEDVRAEADASAAERITEAAAAHASELATLRAAALQDVQDARAEGEAALATLRASCPAVAELTLRVGAQVILIKTLDAEAGLVNGCRGVVTKFLATRNPSVRFDNGVERTLRLEAFGLTQGGQTVACRMQLPLALGWAISVHKSQGMSLDRVEMSLRNVFECGQMYVALSRVRSLEGLSLRGLDWSKLRAHPKVLAWHRAMMSA